MLTSECAAGPRSTNQTKGCKPPCARPVLIGARHLTQDEGHREQVSTIANTMRAVGPTPSARVVEVHPEVSYCVSNGNKSMAMP